MRWRCLTFCAAVFALAPLAPSADPPKRKVDVRATAEQFVKEAVADPAASEAKLKGKLVELTGPVSSTDGGLLTLKAGLLKPRDTFGLFVDAELGEAQQAAAVRLAQNQKVQVTGEVESVAKDRVRLTHCEFRELEPNPLRKVAAADLAAAFAKAANDAGKKFGDRTNPKELLIEGKAGSVKAGEYSTLVNLDVPGKVGVVATLAKSEVVKRGDPLLLKATCRGLDDAGSAVILSATVLPAQAPARAAGGK
ncbi:MAG: hypothetical protein JWO31_3571 [Phycisphaerales bacterium]|nr:hypothetical protein [Phycisphaerales bacterium]